MATVTNQTLYNILLILVQKVNTMSQSFSQQFDALTAAIKVDMDDISAKVDMLLANMHPGDPITQEQIDALSALKTGFDSVASKVDAATAAPPTPAP